MNVLDMRTVIFSAAISSSICAMVIAMLWAQNRKRFAGLGYWLVGFVLLFVALLLIVLRGVVPDFWSMAVGNTLIIGGIVLVYVGLEDFAGKRGAQIHNIVYLVVFSLVHAYFTLVLPSLDARVINFSLGVLIVCFQCAWLLLVRSAPEMRLIGRGVGIVFVGLCLVSVVRIVYGLVAPLGDSLAQSHANDTLLIMNYQMLVIILTFSLFLLVNHRLAMDLEDEFIERKQVNEALGERVKELQCIYELSLLVETPDISLDEILQGSVGLISVAMQYPDLACARITVEDRTYTTEDYREPVRKLSHDISVAGRKIGRLEVGYLEHMEGAGAPLFLEEEKSLLHILAERLGKVIQRKQTEDALQESEEKFYKAFQSSPDAILISRLNDGRLIEVNEGFCRLTGYSREQALSQSSLDLGLWANPQDRNEMIAALREKQRILEQEYEFRTKSGGIVNALFSGEVIFLEDEAHILSVVRDINEQKQAQEALRHSEQKFRGVIEQSWDGITVTDEQGLITEWNRAMERIMGLKAAQVIGEPVWEIQFRMGLEDAKTPQRYQRIKTTIMELLESGQAPWLGQLVDTEFTHPDGTHRFVQSVIFPIKTERGFRLCSIIRDITERKRAEELTRLRLKLWEFAASHPLEELMQTALDEIGALTGSPIGFYHFVEEDQNTLSLQAWSTRTLAEFCEAEGRGLHYDIDEAGVWVDAFRERKAVIHNDYASLAHRKGMPDGHAEVIRELVVPVMREGRVVSILGVGNKAFDYDENDVELVSYIADIIWTIVDRKRAEDQIRQLNSRLEHLAMTDALTGTLNRRSFFNRGVDEFKRFLRYQTPFSLLVLDIDGFKKINDTYGHDAGDKALKCFVNTLQQNIRSTDILARLGGEEFGILLPNTAAENASIAAEKLRLAIEKQPCSIDEGQTVDVTVSIGIDTTTNGVRSFDSILKNADVALYQAKDQGRNRAVQYS